MKRIIIKLLEQRRYHKLKKTNDFNKYPEKNYFGPGSKLSNTKWGRNSGCNHDCNIAYAEIGNYSQIAQNCLIGPRVHLFTNFTINDFIYNTEHLYYLGDGMFNGYFNYIGNDVWIGANSIVLQGVEIGNGAVISAGSVVTKSVPAYAIVGGNPAKIIKFRFTQNQREKLETIRWFDFGIEQIIEKRFELESIVGFDLDNFIYKYWKSKKNILK